MDEFAASTLEDTTQQAPQGNDAVKKNENKFQQAISAWRNIDLTSLVTTLDNTASDIVAYQRDSTVQRKDLAQKTKDFRKLEDPAKLVEIKTLLKAYQTFIDLLTNHSKSTSSAFLQVYSSLSEAPDPYPLLEASVDSLLLSEDTLPKVTAENTHLQGNVSRLTSQLEETESRLEIELSAKKELEDALEVKVKDVETSWAAVLEEKKDNWAAKEKALEDKVENQDRLLNEIKATYEVSQRMGRAEDAENETGRGNVTSAELEMVNSDLERTSIRLAEMEARNEQLRIELAQSASQLPPQPTLAVEDDPAFLRLRQANSALLRKVDAARVEKDAKARDIDGRLRSLDREVNGLKEERDILKAKVQKWNDYDDVKQELEVLKSIEFSTGDDEEGDKEASSDGPKSKSDTLEQLLLARNKKLSDELTILRVSHSDLQSRLQTMQEDISKTNADLERAQNLNATLENDLATIQSESANSFPSGQSVAGTYVSRYQPQASVAPSIYASRRGGKTSPTSSIISGFNPRDLPGTSDGVGGANSTILPMITAQRDRFKKRNQQLEAELSDSHKTISSLRSETASLQKDNLNLYEKTRYVSSYNRNVPSSSASSYTLNPNPSTVQISNLETDPNGKNKVNLDRYRSAYESNISPFAQFRGRESTRAYKRMSLPERIVFSVTRMVLSTRTSRNLFAAYCILLHVLVFFSLFWVGGPTEGHAINLGEAVAVGTAAAVKGGLGGKGEGQWKPEGFEKGA